jgi:hypothetical protein
MTWFQKNPVNLLYPWPFPFEFMAEVPAFLLLAESEDGYFKKMNISIEAMIILPALTGAIINAATPKMLKMVIDWDLKRRKINSKMNNQSSPSVIEDARDSSSVTRWYRVFEFCWLWVSLSVLAVMLLSYQS